MSHLKTSLVIALAAMLFCEASARGAPHESLRIARLPQINGAIVDRLVAQRRMVRELGLLRRAKRNATTHTASQNSVEIASAAGELSFDVAGNLVASRTVLTMTATVPLSQLYLYLQPLTGLQLVVSDAQGPLTTADQGQGIHGVALRDSVGIGEQLVLTIEQQGSPQCQSGFLGIVTCMLSPTMIFDIGNAWQAQLYDPTANALVDPAVTTLAVTVPQPLSVAATGFAGEVTNNGDGSRTFHFLNDIESNVSFSAADFDHGTTAWGDKTIGSFVGTTYAQHAKAWREAAREMMIFHTGRYGEYPVKKIDIAEIPDVVGAAVGPMTTVFIPTTLWTYPPDHWSVTVTLAHELAHQWFGGLISVAEPFSPWLNEGFAVFAETEYTAQEASAELGFDYRTLARLDAMYDYFYRVSPAQDVPITSQLLYQVSGEVYAVLTYDKGMLVVNMIRHALGGQAAFDKAITAYRADHADQGASVASLSASIKASTGKDLTAFFKAWAHLAGYPTFRVHVLREPAASKPASEVVIEADRAAAVPLDVLVATTDGKQASHRLEPDATGETYRLKVEGDLLGVSVDRERHVLGRVRGALAGDIRFDGDVDGVDLIAAAASVGSRFDADSYNNYQFAEWADLEVDGRVNQADVDVVLKNFGKRGGN